MDCFNWCKDQHFANDYQGVWILIWSTFSLIAVNFLPLIQPWLEDMISPQSWNLIYKLLLNIGTMLNIGFLILVFFL